MGVLDLPSAIGLAVPACVEGVSYRLAGLGGVLVVGFALWTVSAAGLQASRIAARLVRGDPDRVDVSVGPSPVAATLDVAPEVRRYRRRSKVRFLLAAAGLCGVVVLLPSPAVAVGLIVLFPLLALLAILARDFAASGSGGPAPGRVAVQLGPPVLLVGGERNVVVMFLVFPALFAVSLGFLLAWVTAGRLVCPEEGTVFGPAGPVGAIMVAVGMLLLRTAQRVATRRSADLLAADARDPVLYLRSFTDDRVRIRTDRLARRTWLDRLIGPTRERFEAAIAWHLWSYGPVVAIRRPGGSRQPLGAARQELDGAAWTRQIDEWLASARLIALTLGRSGGLRWEIDRIRELKLEARLVLLFPPVGEDELARRWLEFQRGWPDSGGIALLPRLALAAVLDPDAPGGATVVTGDVRDEVGYRVAIEAAAKRLGINPVAWDLMPANEPAGGRAFPVPRDRPDLRSTVYHVALRGTVKGPYGAIDLRRMAAYRLISPDTPVTTGGGPWLPVGLVAGIYSRRFRSTTVALAFLGGLFGLDRFYLGKTGSGLAKLLTLAGLGSWWALDLILLAMHRTSDVEGLPLR
jgi:hypothetical protein